MRRGLAALTAVFALIGPAIAQEWPDRPIRLIVPFGPAGSADVVARLISERLGQALGRPVIVENKPGADGIVGMRDVATARPDGYTLLLNVGSAHTLSPLLFKGSPDPVKDFEPIALISRIGFVVVVNEKHPARTLADYVAWVRANQGRTTLSAGSSGVALISEKFKRVTGLTDAVVVSYKGPGFPAVVSGEVDMTIDAFNSIALVKSGRLRPLGVLATRRAAALPDVPTLDELGIPGMAFTSWAGLLGPAGLPRPIVERLSREIGAILAAPDMVRRFAEFNHEIVAGSPSDFAAQIGGDIREWSDLLKTTGYRVQ